MVCTNYKKLKGCKHIVKLIKKSKKWFNICEDRI